LILAFFAKKRFMNFKIHETESGKIAELQSKEVYATVDGFLDILGNASYLGATKIIIFKNNIHPNLFELKTQLAGEVLQKFSTYRQRLAIVGDFSTFKSKSLLDFIRESNKIGHIVFVNSVAEAIKIL